MKKLIWGAGLEAFAERYGMLSAQARDVPTVKINGCTAAEAIHLWMHDPVLQRAARFICRASRDTGCLLEATQVLWDYYRDLASATAFSVIDLQTAGKSQTGKENVYFYCILAKQENWVKSAIWNDWQ